MKEKNLLLISVNQYSVPYPVYPIGLSYIADYLRRKLPEFNVNIFDLLIASGIKFDEKYLV